MSRAPRWSGICALVSLTVFGTFCHRSGEIVATLPNVSYTPFCAAADMTHVYWTAAGHVFRVRRGGGPVEDFESTGGDPRALGVLGRDVWWIDRETNTIHTKPKAGGTARMLAHAPDVSVLGCAVEDEAALYTSGAASFDDAGRNVRGFFVRKDAIVTRTDKATGTTTTLLTLPFLPPADPRDPIDAVGAAGYPSIALDAVYLYVRFEREPYRIRRMPKAGGVLEELSTRDRHLDPPNLNLDSWPLDAPPRIALAGDRVYFVANGQILWLPKTGGVPTPFVSASVQRVSASTDQVCGEKPGEVTCLDATGTPTFTAPAGSRFVGLFDGDLFWTAGTADASFELRHRRL